MKTNSQPSFPPRDVTRREFLRTSSKSVALLGAASSVLMSGQEVLGANEKIGLGFIGVGGRGSSHLQLIHACTTQGQPLRIVAVCDAYGPRLRDAA